MILSSNYLPCIAYMMRILNQNEIYLNISEQYRKQSYSTRAYILGPHQVETLIIPVKKSPNNTHLGDILISYADDWQKNHFKTIQNNYKNSPFFEHLIHLFEPLYFQRIDKLVDFNSKILSVCLKILKINPTICHNSYEYFDNKNEFISFNSKNRADIDNNLLPIKYFQNFGKDFEPNLSIIDLLFAKGPDSFEFLNKYNSD